MRKLGTALCLSALLVASSAAQARGWEGNWLFGASAVYGKGHGTLNTTVYDVATDTEVTSFGIDIDRKGWGWGLLTGYQARCNGWLVGGELAVDWPNHKHSTSYTSNLVGTDVAGVAEYHQDVVVALTGRLGFAINSFFLPYLRAGIETGRDKIELSASQAGVNFLNLSDRRQSVRFVGGIGAEIPVPVLDGLSARVEYNYHSKGGRVSADGQTVDGVYTVHSDIHGHANTGKLSLVYNFI